MHPEIFTIPGTRLIIQSYGFFMVLGFISAIWIIRVLSKKITPDPQLITNAALYSLIAGVVGARIMYVILEFEHFKDHPLDVFAIWKGGLVQYGGVILAIVVIISYLIYHKLPKRQYLDILAIGLMAALIFGRFGCFMRGCCFGKPTEVPWAVRFPYGSDAYHSQAFPDEKRNRMEPLLDLPDDYYISETIDGNDYVFLKPYEYLTPEQQQKVTKGQYRCIPVHPTQIYSSLNAAAACLILFLLWRRMQKAAQNPNNRKFLTAPGTIFASMFILIGGARFYMEYLRDDNPFIIEGIPLTVSQYIAIGLIMLGIIQIIGFSLYARIKATSNNDGQNTESQNTSPQ